MSKENVDLLKKVKSGVVPFSEISELIEQYQEKLMEDQEASILPEEPDLKVFQDVQIKIYKMLIKDEI